MSRLEILLTSVCEDHFTFIVASDMERAGALIGRIAYRLESEPDYVADYVRRLEDLVSAETQIEAIVAETESLCLN